MIDRAISGEMKTWLVHDNSSISILIATERGCVIYFLMSSDPLFDRFANSYHDELNSALAATGADSTFFAEGRVKWLAKCLARLGQTPQRAMDYGCGTGSTTPLLSSILGVNEVIGVDVSPRIIATAREKYASEQVQFSPVAEFTPAGNLDLAYCNGVFHHIPKPHRAGALEYIHRAIHRDGFFALWENNPWNPGTQYVMSKCSFDKDAEKLSVFEATKLLRQAGFTIYSIDFVFVFPQFLSALRSVEPWICKLPLGAQYQILARKTHGSTDGAPAAQRARRN